MLTFQNFALLIVIVLAVAGVLSFFSVILGG
jgi:hypothetical protein